MFKNIGQEKFHAVYGKIEHFWYYLKGSRKTSLPQIINFTGYLGLWSPSP